MTEHKKNTKKRKNPEEVAHSGERQPMFLFKLYDILEVSLTII